MCLVRYETQFLVLWFGTGLISIHFDFVSLRAKLEFLRFSNFSISTHSAYMTANNHHCLLIHNISNTFAFTGTSLQSPVIKSHIDPWWCYMLSWNLFSFASDDSLLLKRHQGITPMSIEVLWYSLEGCVNEFHIHYWSVFENYTVINEMKMGDSGRSLLDPLTFTL